MKIFILLLAMDNRLYPWANGISGGVQRHIGDESILMIAWAGCSESALVQALWPVTSRHKPVTPKIKGRIWLCLCSRPVTEMFKLSFRSLFYGTNHKPVPWEMAASTVLRSGETWCKYVQLAAHVVLFIQLDSRVLCWEVQYGFLWK